jgi:hypothetical protein
MRIPALSECQEENLSSCLNIKKIATVLKNFLSCGVGFGVPVKREITMPVDTGKLTEPRLSLQKLQYLTARFLRGIKRDAD